MSGFGGSPGNKKLDAAMLLKASQEARPQLSS